MSGSVRDAVEKGYAEVARQGLSSRDPALHRIAEAFGYDAATLAEIPAEANMGLSCGNPVALASLRPGEVVVDLGSGGGLDVFVAARGVGPSGRVIGIDMTDGMIDLARRNAAMGGYSNVEFHKAEIAAMPLNDGTADCVISNCVLNLVEDKDAALADIFRTLKPGGRLSISDIALLRPLPEEVAADIAAWVSCISGAIPIETYRAKLEAAGFSSILIRPTGADLNVYKEAGGDGGCCAPQPAPSCCGGTSQSAYGHATGSLRALDLNAHAQAVQIMAVKP